VSKIVKAGKIRDHAVELMSAGGCLEPIRSSRSKFVCHRNYWSRDGREISITTPFQLNQFLGLAGGDEIGVEFPYRLEIWTPSAKPFHVRWFETGDLQIVTFRSGDGTKVSRINTIKKNAPPGGWGIPAGRALRLATYSPRCHAKKNRQCLI
jgi:hypothetical protein